MHREPQQLILSGFVKRFKKAQGERKQFKPTCPIAGTCTQASGLVCKIVALKVRWRLQDEGLLAVGVSR